MKRTLLLLALASLALPAAATVYQPGLWFVHSETKDDVGTGVAARADKVPCQGAFMEYTTSYATNWTNNGGYHESTSFGMSGTNAYDNMVYTWRHNTGFGYAGEFFVEKGRTYTFGEWHGTFLKILLDGEETLKGDAWFDTRNGTYTAAATGWIPFELRAGIGTEAGIAGPLYNDFGTGFNTNGVRISGRGDRTWGLPPWRRILDPGDCSLLRIAVTDADYAALDSVAASGSDLALSVSFSGVPSAGRLTAFWGGSNGGDLPSAWTHSCDLGPVAAGSAPGVPCTVPDAAGAAFVALRLQNTNYATGPYTQFTEAAVVPRPTPTFDLFCTEIGYTSLVFRAVVAAVGTGASAIDAAEVQIATDTAFGNVVKRLPLSISGPGSEVLSTAGLVSNTVYYARVAGSNDAGASGVSATVGPLRTRLPTMSTSTIVALDSGLGAVNAAVTVTDWGEDSHGARVWLEACRSPRFEEQVFSSEPVDLSETGVATNLQVSGLQELTDYYVRAHVVNSWGFDERPTLADPLTTRGYPFLGTHLVWETAENGTLSVHERLLEVDAGVSGTAELFLGGVSKGVRAFSGPCRLSWTGLPMPDAPTAARVVVSVYIGTGLYSKPFEAIVIPGTANYLEDKWIYDPSARTLSWTDSYPSLNVVSNVTARGIALTIGPNRFNPLAVNLDFSPGVEGGWEISNIVSSAFVVEQNTDSAAVTNVVFPPTLREVGRAAFSGAKNLRRAVFNEGLVDLGTDGSSYGNYCFNGCTSLESIGPLPSTLRIVGMRLFTGCTSLTNDIVWPRGLPVVPEYAFQNTSIRSFKAEYGVTHLGPYGTEARVTSGNNAIRTIDLPVTLQYVAGRMFSDTKLDQGFTANVWYRGFPKLGWHKSLWDSMTWGKTTVTNWFEFHHKDEFEAFARTNEQFQIVLPATYTGEGTWAANGGYQVIRWWKDPNQYPPSVMILR